MGYTSVKSMLSGASCKIILSEEWFPVQSALVNDSEGRTGGPPTPGGPFHKNLDLYKRYVEFFLYGTLHGHSVAIAAGARVA